MPLTLFSACDKSLDASNFLALSGFTNGRQSKVHSVRFDYYMYLSDYGIFPDHTTTLVDNIVDCIKLCKHHRLKHIKCKVVRFSKNQLNKEPSQWGNCYFYYASQLYDYEFGMDWTDNIENEYDHYAGIVCDCISTSLLLFYKKKFT